jgi:predicted enzyme related to lactoylglutathione lyase
LWIIICQEKIPADNVESLKDFYSSLIGWQFEKGQTQGYWIIKNAGISGGLMQKDNPEQISSMFIEVESIEDYTYKAKGLGSKVVKDKQEISEGFYAVLEDPQGNSFGVWQNK